MEIRSTLVGIGLCISSLSQAAIVGGSVTGGESLIQGGTFIKLDVPFLESEPDNTVGDNTFQTPHLYGFDEGQNIEISESIRIDIFADDTPDTIPDGTTVASHYIFFDPGPSTTQIGTVTFNSKIFGVITTRSKLRDSDFLLNTGVNYLNPSFRGLESGDSVSILDDFTIGVDWRASSPGDYVRVLTEFSPPISAVPLPASAWLFCSAILGLAGASIRKKIQ